MGANGLFKLFLYHIFKLFRLKYIDNLKTHVIIKLQLLGFYRTFGFLSYFLQL